MNFRLRLSELPLRGMNFGRRPNELRKAHCGVLIFAKIKTYFNPSPKAIPQFIHPNG